MSDHIRPRPSLFRRVVVAAAVVMSVTVTTAGCAPASASASARSENVLRGWCSSARTVECVVQANDDDGVVFIGRSGHRYHPSSPAKAVKYLSRHAVACKVEDGAHCWWNAGTSGNRVGHSFMVTGGHAEGEGTVFYLALA